MRFRTHDRRRTPLTSDVQREAMAVLAEVRALSPDVRLGQWLAHLGFLGEAPLGRGLGDIEEDELMAVLDRHRAELVARTEGEPSPAPMRTRAALSASGSPPLIEAAPATELDR